MTGGLHGLITKFFSLLVEPSTLVVTWTFSSGNKINRGSQSQVAERKARSRAARGGHCRGSLE